MKRAVPTVNDERVVYIISPNVTPRVRVRVINSSRIFWRCGGLIEFRVRWFWSKGIFGSNFRPHFDSRQIIVVSDGGPLTFAGIYYGQIQWTTGDSSDGVNGLLLLLTNLAPICVEYPCTHTYLHACLFDCVMQAWGAHQLKWVSMLATREISMLTHIHIEMK